MFLSEIQKYYEIIDVENAFVAPEFPAALRKIKSSNVHDMTKQLNDVKNTQEEFRIDTKLLKKTTALFNQLFGLDLDSIEFSIVVSKSFFSELVPFEDWKEKNATNPLFTCILSKNLNNTFELFAGTLFHELSHVSESLHSSDFVQTHDGVLFNEYIKIGSILFPTLVPLVTKHDYEADRGLYRSLAAKNEIIRRRLLASKNMRRNTIQMIGVPAGKSTRLSPVASNTTRTEIHVQHPNNTAALTKNVNDHKCKLEKTPKITCLPQTVRLDMTATEFTKWSCEEVHKYFLEIFPEHAHVFKEEEIDGEALNLITREDWRRIGQPLGPMVKIYDHIKKMQNGKLKKLIA